CALVVFPDDRVCQGACTTERDRHGNLGWETGGGKDQRVAGRGRRKSGALNPLMTPDLFSSGRIVTNHKLATTGHEFCPFGSANQQWCRPADLHFAWTSPNFLPGLLINTDDERGGALLFTA